MKNSVDYEYLHKLDRIIQLLTEMNERGKTEMARVDASLDKFAEEQVQRQMDAVRQLHTEFETEKVIPKTRQ